MSRSPIFPHMAARLGGYAFTTYVYVLAKFERGVIAICWQKLVFSFPIRYFLLAKHMNPRVAKAKKMQSGQKPPRAVYFASPAAQTHKNGALIQDNAVHIVLTPRSKLAAAIYGSIALPFFFPWEQKKNSDQFVKKKQPNLVFVWPLRTVPTKCSAPHRLASVAVSALVSFSAGRAALKWAGWLFTIAAGQKLRQNALKYVQKTPKRCPTSATGPSQNNNPFSGSETRRPLRWLARGSSRGRQTKPRTIGGKCNERTFYF